MACTSTSRCSPTSPATNLDYHGDMACYGAAKARLFAWPGLQAAAVNLDDDSAPSARAPASGVQVSA
jgi:UDP-N-acetylmuramyl tripeptide synthase